MDSDRSNERTDRTRNDREEDESVASTNDVTRDDAPNPPRTTTGVWTSPKFGSAGSGGAELEPGPEKD